MVEREHGLPAATASAVAGLVEGDWLHLGQPIRVPQQPALPPARPEAGRRGRLQVRRPRDGDILREQISATISFWSVPSLLIFC